jgi:hypothetical protein
VTRNDRIALNHFDEPICEHLNVATESYFFFFEDRSGIVYSEARIQSRIRRLKYKLSMTLGSVMGFALSSAVEQSIQVYRGYIYTNHSVRTFSIRFPVKNLGWS